MTLPCSGMLWIDSGCDLQSFWHGGQVASRLTLASFLFWWVCLNISKYAPKASANMQFPSSSDHWGCIILKSLFHWFHGSWPLASSLNFLFTLSWLYYPQVCWGLTLDLMGLLEYFQICTQSFRKYAVSNHFRPLGAALYSNHYFIGFMVPDLWPIV